MSRGKRIRLTAWARRWDDNLGVSDVRQRQAIASAGPFRQRLTLADLRRLVEVTSTWNARSEVTLQTSGDHITVTEVTAGGAPDDR